MNECDSPPCVHGTCENLPGTYSCDCEDGYEGQDCDEEGLPKSSCHAFFSVLKVVSLFVPVTNECVGVTCENGGTCVDGYHIFECDCLDQYGGVFCEIGIVYFTTACVYILYHMI